MTTHNITIYPDGKAREEILVRQWDNLSHVLVFTLPPEIVGDRADLRILPNGAKAPYVYPCELTGSRAECTPTYEAWGWQGTAYIQLVIYAGENVVWQSAKIPVTVQGSIDEAGATTPEEGKTLVEQLQAAINEAAGIIDFDVAAVPLDQGATPTADRVVDPATGKSTIVFGIAPGPEGPQGVQGPAGEQGPAGQPGETAVSAINPRGDYAVDAFPPYTLNDYMTYANGNAYVCKRDNPTNEPPTDGSNLDPFWQLLALRGAQGPQGIQGPAGVQGPAGIQGPPGMQGPRGDDGPAGPQGPKGETGEGVRILGTYATLDDLRASVLDPEQGDMYNVGASAPYNVYMWEQSVQDWVDQGQLQGPEGPEGPQGAIGPEGPGGPQGFSPTIAEKDGNTDADYRLVVTNEGGSYETPNLKAVHTVSNAEVYSTEETVIGTWIDGKPLYRKVLVGQTADTANTRVSYDLPQNVDMVIDCRGYVITPEGSPPLNFDYVLETSASARIFVTSWVNVNLKNFTILTATPYTGMPFFAVLEYTKLTDTATIDIPDAAAMNAAYDEGVQSA